MADSTDEFAGIEPADPTPAPDEFAGVEKADDQDPYASFRHKNGMYHYTDPKTNLETFSQHAPPAGAVPYKAPTAADVTPDENFDAGMGKAVVDSGRGVRQIALHIGHHLGLVSNEGLANDQSTIDEAKKNDAPLLQTGAGAGGYLAGSAAETALLPGSGSVLGNAALGAATGALQPVASDESRLQNAGLGAAIGGGLTAVGKTAARVLRPIGETNPSKLADSQLLNSEGIQTDLAQETGAKGPTTIKRASQMTSNKPAEFEAEQQKQVNRAVVKRMGEDADNAGPDVMDRAEKRIGGVMNGITGRTKVPMDNALYGDMIQVEHDMHRTLGAGDQGPIKQHLADILSNAASNGGTLQGEYLKTAARDLGELSKNPTYSKIAGDLHEALRDATTRYAAPADVTAMTTARQQYRAMKQIEGGIVKDSEGDVSPRQLVRSMSKMSNRKQMLYGRGDQSLVDLAKAASRTVPDKLGNSGTAERLLPLSLFESATSEKPISNTARLVAGWGGVNKAGEVIRGQSMPWLKNYLREGAPGGAAIRKIFESPDVKSKLSYALPNTGVGTNPQNSEDQ